MMTFETQVRIKKPVDEVFALLCDLDKSKDWMAGLEDIELTSGSLGEVGSRLKLVFNEGGRSIMFDEELLTIKENESFSFRLNSADIEMTTEIYLKRVDTKTEILMINVVKGKRFFMKLMMPFMRKVMVDRQMKDLGSLKTLMES